MTPEKLLALITGPAGALVLAVLALVVALRMVRYQAQQTAAQAKAIRDQLESEIASLRRLLDLEQRDHQATAQALDAEHRARLDDLRSYTARLLQITNRVHETIDRLPRLRTPSASPGPPLPEASPHAPRGSRSTGTTTETAKRT